MINMKDLIKHQTNAIRKESGMNIKEEENPCWKGYEMVGTKMKNGKEVPNCVPIKEEKIEEGKADQSFHKSRALLRKESRRLNDDDAYELSTKLKAWFDRHIF